MPMLHNCLLLSILMLLAKVLVFYNIGFTMKSGIPTLILNDMVLAIQTCVSMMHMLLVVIVLSFFSPH
jgi:hypothetical protein